MVCKERSVEELFPNHTWKMCWNLSFLPARLDSTLAHHEIIKTSQVIRFFFFLFSSFYGQKSFPTKWKNIQINFLINNNSRFFRRCRFGKIKSRIVDRWFAKVKRSRRRIVARQQWKLFRTKNEKSFIQQSAPSRNFIFKSFLGNLWKWQRGAEIGDDGA